MKVLIATDKFKGSLTAPQAAGAIRRGLARGLPSAWCREFPIADGGEGTAEILCAALHGRWTTALVHGPLGQVLEAGYGWLPGEVAVIGMSAASGLACVPPDQRDVLRASTFGTGELMRHATERGARKILLGLGGSATNDAGAGAAAACGYRFVDCEGMAIDPLPAVLPRVARITRPEKVFPEIVAMCDVENPLLGPRGAAWTYGPQKGGTPQTLRLVEDALTHLADIVARDLGHDFREARGAGAAGGMGYGLVTFFGAQLRSGFEIIAEAMHLEEAVAESDLVITGEGSLDSQSLEGKGPVGVARLARTLGKPVLAFAGASDHSEALDRIFDGVFTIREEAMPLELAIRQAENLLEDKVAWIASAGLIQQALARARSAHFSARPDQIWVDSSCQDHG